MLADDVLTGPANLELNKRGTQISDIFRLEGIATSLPGKTTPTRSVVHCKHIGTTLDSTTRFHNSVSLFVRIKIMKMSLEKLYITKPNPQF